MTKPNKFVSIHNHTGFSPFDGLGYPSDHFEFCIQNGLDAHAITEHGQMNSYAHAQLWIEDYNKKHDKKFKYIPGVEAYFHPDLDKWARDKQDADDARHDKKVQKKLRAEQEKLQTKIIEKTDASDDTESVEMTNALTIENEDETKGSKQFNPVNRRHHLVILPKTSRALQKLFALVSKSYLTGFYRFPRIDSRMLREASKDSCGELLVSSACLGGTVMYTVFQALQEFKLDSIDQSLLDDPYMLSKVLDAMGNDYDLMTSCVGRENYYLELQFNRLPAQNLLNRSILEFARKHSLEDKLVITCDAHYYNPDVWRERELYKRLGFMNYSTYSPDNLPKSKQDLKYELYPKNVDQIWEEYMLSKQGTSFYDDKIICDAIERTHDIAHEVIGDITPDRNPKYAYKKLVPEGEKSFNYLVQLCKEGMKKRGLISKPEYVPRLKEELEVIKKMGNADYFVSYRKIVELAREVALLGPARGSGGGSLVNYLLEITDLDPIKWDLPFARFLSVYRVGLPDIDTDISNRDKVIEKLKEFFGEENVVSVSNYNTFKVKSLVKDVSKFYGIPFDEVNEALKTVEQSVRKATTKHGDDKNLFVLTYEEAVKYDDRIKKFIEKYPHVGESINILFKQNRSLGKHAGGVIISDELPDKMPLITSKGEPQSPFVEGVGYKHLEKIGNFCKYDLLGLETLRLIEHTVELIIEKEGLVELDVEGVKYRLLSTDRIKLTDGREVLVSELTEDDDVVVPVEKCK